MHKILQNDIFKKTVLKNFTWFYISSSIWTSIQRSWPIKPAKLALCLVYISQNSYLKLSFFGLNLYTGCACIDDKKQKKERKSTEMCIQVPRLVYISKIFPTNYYW